MTYVTAILVVIAFIGIVIGIMSILFIKIDRDLNRQYWGPILPESLEPYIITRLFDKASINQFSRGDHISIPSGYIAVHSDSRSSLSKWHILMGKEKYQIPKNSRLHHDIEKLHDRLSLEFVMSGHKYEKP